MYTTSADIGEKKEVIKGDSHSFKIAELRSCVKVEVDVLGSRPYKPTVSVDVKQHSNQPKFKIACDWSVVSLLESRG